MPGKVNPVIPEVVNQIAFEVIGNDVTVTLAAEAGQLQLNAFEPIIAHSLFKSVLHLTKGCVVLADRCVDGITANRDALRASVERSIGIVTALNPYIGYAHATDVAAEAHASGRGVAEIVLERGLMTAEATCRGVAPRSADPSARPACPQGRLIPSPGYDHESQQILTADLCRADPRHPRRLRLQPGCADGPEAAKEIAGYFGIMTDIFLRLIKMIIAPLVFATLVSGLANMGDSKTVGRIGTKALGWFVVASLVLAVARPALRQPAAARRALGMPLPEAGTATNLKTGALNLKDFITQVFPKSIVEAMAATRNPADPGVLGVLRPGPRPPAQPGGAQPGADHG
jgi:hypothetical protein